MGRALILLAPPFSCHFISYLSLQHRHLSVSPLVTYSHHPSRLLSHSRLESDQLKLLRDSRNRRLSFVRIFQSSLGIYFYSACLTRNSLSGSPHHQFREHPSSRLWPGSFLSQYHLSISHVIFIPPSPRHPDRCGPRLLAICTTRSHHSRTTRVYLWRSTPRLLAQLQLYMVSIARPFSAFMMCLSVSHFSHTYDASAFVLLELFLLRNSDPSTTRKTPSPLATCLFAILGPNLLLEPPFPSFETPQKHFLSDPKKQSHRPYP
jgi:hypothetical protein